MRDETFDYGLEPGESFEPIDDADDIFDLTQPHIQTALGPIDPDDLGYTAILGPSGPRADRWSRNPGATVAALEDAYNGGLRGLVIAEPLRTEQEVADLIWIAGRSPIHLIAARDPSGPNIFTNTSLRPGCISVATTSRPSPVRDEFADDVEQLPRVLVLASDQRIIVVPPSAARVNDLERFTKTSFVWEADASIFDGDALYAVYTSRDQPLRDAELTSMHSASALLLALAPSPASWLYAVERSPLELMERGFDAPTVRRILVDNPVRALTIRG